MMALPQIDLSGLSLAALMDLRDRLAAAVEARRGEARRGEARRGEGR